MKKIQNNTQEIEISIKSWKNYLKCEDRHSDLEDQIAGSDQERKSLLKITRNKETIQKNNVRLMRVNEKRVNINDRKRLFTEVTTENFPRRESKLTAK